jgi:hypothetical protein
LDDQKWGEWIWADKNSSRRRELLPQDELDQDLKITSTTTSSSLPRSCSHSSATDPRSKPHLQTTQLRTNHNINNMRQIYLVGAVRSHGGGGQTACTWEISSTIKRSSRPWNDSRFHPENPLIKANKLSERNPRREM